MVSKAKKKSGSRGTKKTLLAITSIEEREVTLDSKTLESLESFIEKNGGKNSGLTLSDAVAHLLLEKSPSGFKFKAEKIEHKTVTLKLPAAAWSIAEKSAKKSSSDMQGVIKKLAESL